MATNTGYGLSYTDAGGRSLVTNGGAGFSRADHRRRLHAADPPVHLHPRTNGTDGVTTWISFSSRVRPTVRWRGIFTAAGANVPHDFGTIQKLATGNSSGAGSNTVGLIPTGAAANLKGRPTPSAA